MPNLGGPVRPMYLVNPMVSMLLNADALADCSPQYAQAMALLLAGETFLSAAQDSGKPLELRVELDRAAHKLLTESANHVLRSHRSED